MIEITINGEIFNANVYDCHPTSVFLGDRTQTLDGVEHIEGRKIKRYISATFTDIPKAEAYRLLKALYKSDYTEVNYFDQITDTRRNGIFIMQSDPSAPIKLWKANKKYYESMTVELLEKGAE